MVFVFFILHSMKWLITEKIIIRIINLHTERAVQCMKLAVNRNRFLTLCYLDLATLQSLIRFFLKQAMGNFWPIFYPVTWSWSLLFLESIQQSAFLPEINPAITSTCQESILQSPPTCQESILQSPPTCQKPILQSPPTCQKPILQSPLPVRNQSCNHLYLSEINPAITSTCQKPILQSPLPVRN